MARPPKDQIPTLAAMAPPEESAERAAVRRRGMRDPLEGCPMMLRVGSGTNAEIVEVGPGRWREMALADPRTGLPPGCPVIALGIGGSDAYFLNTLGEIVRLTGSQSGKGPLDVLFAGRGGWMVWAWPRWTKGTEKSPPQVNGWAADVARVDLLRACYMRGIYDESTAVRGLGAWLADDGGLIYHAGDAVLIDGAWREPGEFGAAIYPARRTIARPAAHPEPAGTGSAGDYFLELRSAGR
jgi:hypothetical protein